MGASRVVSPVYLPPLVMKSHDSAAGTSTGILTWHTKDLEGEIIRPAGVRLDSAKPYPVDWLHDVYVGKGLAERKAVKDRNEDGSEVWRTVPIGTTHFFRKEADLGDFNTGRFSRAECVDAGCQAAELVLADIAPGISIEIEPLSKVYLNKSLAKNGPAYRYDDSRLIGWAHTPMGRQVQPWAMTLVEKSLEVGRSGKLPGGAAMLPTIRKAFDSLLAAHPRPASVTSGFTVEKGMPPDAPPMDSAAVDAPAVEEPGTEQQGTATARAAYNLAQGASDLKAAAEADMKDGEHVKGKGKLGKLLEKLIAIAEEASAVGDMVAADVNQGGDDEADESAEGDEADDSELDDDEPTEKAFKPLKKSLDGSLETATGFKPRRFGPRDLADVSKATDAPNPELEVALAGAVAELRQAARPAARRRTNR